MIIPVLILASVFYQPLPTAKTLWERYERTAQAFSADGQQYVDRFAAFPNAPTQCLREFQPLQAQITELYGKEMWAIAKYYEMYGDEDAYDRYKDKEKEFEKQKREAFRVLDKCLSNAEKGLKEAQTL